GAALGSDERHCRRVGRRRLARRRPARVRRRRLAPAGQREQAGGERRARARAQAARGDAPVSATARGASVAADGFGRGSDRGSLAPAGRPEPARPRHRAARPRRRPFALPTPAASWQTRPGYTPSFGPRIPTARRGRAGGDTGWETSWAT